MSLFAGGGPPPGAGGANLQADLARQICQAAATSVTAGGTASVPCIHEPQAQPVDPCTTSAGAECAVDETTPVATSQDLSAPMVEAAQQLFFVQRADLQSPRSVAATSVDCTRSAGAACSAAHTPVACETCTGQGHASAGGLDDTVVHPAEHGTSAGDQAEPATSEHGPSNELARCSDDLIRASQNTETAVVSSADHVSGECAQIKDAAAAPGTVEHARKQPLVSSGAPAPTELQPQPPQDSEGCCSAEISGLVSHRDDDGARMGQAGTTPTPDVHTDELLGANGSTSDDRGSGTLAIDANIARREPPSEFQNSFCTIHLQLGTVRKSARSRVRM